MGETTFFSVRPYCHLNQGMELLQEGTTVALSTPLDNIQMQIIQETNSILDNLTLNSSLCHFFLSDTEGLVATVLFL